MAEQHEHKDTPRDALMAALATCEVEDKFKDVLIIYNTESGASGSYDSGLTMAEAGYLAFLFMLWQGNCGMGVVMGNIKRELFAHVGFEDPERPDEGKKHV